MPRLDEFMTFCKVVELKSFSRAADVLGISQPAVSQQIRSLEASYGAELLHRLGIEILPTEQGQAVYLYACQMVEVFEKSRQKVNSIGGQFDGRLQVGASTGPGEFLVPLLLGKFKTLHTGVKIALHIDDSKNVVEDVFSHKFEVGFVGMFRRDRHLSFQSYLQDDLVLAVYPDHPLAGRACVSFDEFLRAPLILQQQGSGATQVLQDALREQGLQVSELNVVMELGLQESTKAAVRAGYGATIISRLGVREELSRGVLVEVPVEGLELSRNIYICYYRSAPLSNLAQAFLDFALEYKDSLFAEDQGGTVK